MAWDKIIDEQANVDSPIFTAFQDGDVSPLTRTGYGVHSVKIIVQTIDPNKKYTMYFLDEEIEDFYFFMKSVYEATR